MRVFQKKKEKKRQKQMDTYLLHHNNLKETSSEETYSPHRQEWREKEKDKKTALFSVGVWPSVSNFNVQNSP